MSCASIHGGGSNAERAVHRDKWQRDCHLEDRGHRQAMRPRVSRRQFAQWSRDAQREFQLQVGVRLFLHVITSEEGDSVENYEYNVRQIRNAFADLGYTPEKAVEFIHSQIAATGARPTQRCQISRMKALLPGEYLTEVEEIFQAYGSRSLLEDNILEFPFLQGAVTGD